jgi:uncharacterized protein
MGLTADRLKRVITRYHDRLSSYREALNGLNVYPVPDGDTGTNMSLTLGSVLAHVEHAVSMEDVARGLADGSLLGARGNSGVILSQILRGFADAFRHEDEIGVPHLVDALDRASTAAYQAVLRPQEGTILTIVREASEAASEAGTTVGNDLAALLERVYSRSEDALERTPEMLPVLRQAGVVDAGGAGLLLLIAAFLEEVTGVEVRLPERLLTAHADLGALGLGAPGLDRELAGLRYEVMFFLETTGDRLAEFRERWSGLGDSIVVVGGDGLYNCHIHTDEIGPAIEAGVAVGRPRDIRVTDLVEQAGDHEVHAGVSGFRPRPEVLESPIGVVAVVSGPGLVGVFTELGVQAVVSGGQTMNPSTEDLLAVVESIPADCVVVLPNNKNIVPVAEQLDGLTTKSVVVVPTRSVPQGIAAMLAYSPTGSHLDPLVDDMAAAASSVVDGEVTRAVRDAVVEFGRISQGEWLGIADGTIVVSDRDQQTVLRGLVASILPVGAELLTVYVGEHAEPSASKALEAWLGELHPLLEVEFVAGGQPLYPYLVSVE